MFVLFLFLTGCSSSPENNTFGHYVQITNDSPAKLNYGTNLRLASYPVANDVKQRDYVALFSVNYKKQNITFWIERTLLPYISKDYKKILKLAEYIKNTRLFSKNIQYDFNYYFTTAMSFSEHGTTLLNTPKVNLYRSVENSNLNNVNFVNLIASSYTLLVHEITHVASAISHGSAHIFDLNEEYIAYKVGYCSTLLKNSPYSYLGFKNDYPDSSREDLLASLEQKLDEGLARPTQVAPALVVFDLANYINNDYGVTSKEEYKKAQTWCGKLSEYEFLSNFLINTPEKYDNLKIYPVVL